MQAAPTRFARVLKTRDVLMLSFGAMIGWSWILMTGYWVGNAGSIGTLIAFAAGGLVDAGFILVGLAGAVAMTWINVVGIRTAAIVQGVVTIAIFVSGLVLFTGAAGFGLPELAEPRIAVPATGILTVLIMVPALLVGFDVLPQSAEEIDLPPKRIGRLLIVSLAMAVVCLFMPFSPSGLVWTQEWGIVLGWGAAGVIVWLTRGRN